MELIFEKMCILHNNYYDSIDIWQTITRFSYRLFVIRLVIIEIFGIDWMGELLVGVPVPVQRNSNIHLTSLSIIVPALKCLLPFGKY